jgi:class 3 adenylate cyclase
MTTCPTCGADGPQGARFCPACGSALAERQGHAAERKVVTTLFADLVGFTALSERFDPEDVDAALRGYFEMSRKTIERFGGVVEKYIGDAVVGLFGVPLAHEDDAERAVRAALDIVAHMGELPALDGERLQVRAAANTGPALVRLRARPGSGEGALVGDAVNTAARLLAQAPAMGVVVGETTQRLTSRTIAYEAMAPCAAKGKAMPIERWLAQGAIARRGMVDEPAEQSPCIGREVELAVLDGLLARAVASRTRQYALVVGEAGIGKSRLLREFLHRLDDRPGFFCIGRQGHCPAYGSDLAFWPLREIVSAHAGILGTDEAAVIEEKLARSLGDARDREWMLARLRPLVGLPAAAGEREDNFIAWRRFLENMSPRDPAILVIEDIHWASETTLAFLEYLVRSTSEKPCLVIVTARPEFLTDQTGEYVDMLTRIDLRSLSSEDSARLALSLPVVSGRLELAAAVGEACGGNPLFAEELARFMAEHGAGTPNADDDAAVSGSPPSPDGIMALIAARLDALPAEARAVLMDASVTGQVFWPGAVAAAGSELEDMRHALADLVSRDFLVERRVSSLTGDTEYAFRHAFMRQVAYAQLTRGRRARKHAKVAEWMESAQASFSLAEPLAYHYETAFDLAEAVDDDELTSTLRLPAARALETAGDETLPLDVATAERRFRKAAALIADGVSERPGLLGKWADALWESGREREAIDAEDKCIAALEVAGAHEKAAIARIRRAFHQWDLDSSEWPQLPTVAVDLLDHGEGSEDLIPLLEYWAYVCFFRDDRRAGVAAATRAIESAERLGLPRSVRGYCLRGIGRCEDGDSRGLDDIQRALEEARRQGAELMAAAVAENLADQRCAYRGPAAAIGILRQSLDRARSRHDDSTATSVQAGLAFNLWWSGKWDEADELTESLDSVLERRGLELLGAVRSLAALSRLLRGRLEEAERLAASAEQLCRRSKRFENRSASLLALAIVRGARGDLDAARALLQACDTLEGGGRMLPEYILPLSLACRTSIAAGDHELAQRLAADLGTRPLDQCARVSLEAALAEARRDLSAADLHADAARRWADMGVPYEQAWSLLRGAQCLQETGRLEEAEAGARRAQAVFAALGAEPALSASADLLGSLAQERS